MIPASRANRHRADRRAERGPPRRARLPRPAIIAQHRERSGIVNQEHSQDGRIAAIFVGEVSPLPPEGQPTGIFKRPVASASVTTNGIAGDHQADRRVHGGPEKAVHQYTTANYARLAVEFPAIAPALVPGSLGENLSAHGWSEDNVHIGDVFRIGTVRLQVSQPRSPCWKINHKFGVAELSRHIAATGITGWYYRVLAPGRIAVGDPFERVEQAADPITIADFWRIVLAHRPNPNELARLAACPGLAPNWRTKLADRVAWLRGR
jgi:MOSC domain-containing protein YiiM